MTATNLTEDERKSLTALLRCLNTFAEINSQMPVGEAASFVQVALEPYKGPDEYSRITGFADHALSRWLLDMSQANRGSTDVQLLQWRPNPENLRRKQYFLTGKVLGIVTKFLTALGRA